MHCGEKSVQKFRIEAFGQVSQIANEEEGEGFEKEQRVQENAKVYEEGHERRMHVETRKGVE